MLTAIAAALVVAAPSGATAPLKEYEAKFAMPCSVASGLVHTTLTVEAKAKAPTEVIPMEKFLSTEATSTVHAPASLSNELHNSFGITHTKGFVKKTLVFSKNATPVKGNIVITKLFPEGLPYEAPVETEKEEVFTAPKGGTYNFPEPTETEAGATVTGTPGQSVELIAEHTEGGIESTVEGFNASNTRVLNTSAICTPPEGTEALLGKIPIVNAPMGSGIVFLENGKTIGTERTIAVGYGELKLESPEESEGGIGNTLECVNVEFGSLHNEGSPLTGSGSIDTVFAAGHVPVEGHPQYSGNCRLVHHGADNGTERASWATAEPHLGEPRREAQVCVNPSKKLNECTGASERETEQLITEVKREPLAVPWEVEEISTEATRRTRIGVPTTEEQAAGHTSCEVFPSPKGCIKVQILVPELALADPFEGSVDPLDVNGVKNALSPSVLSFEGKGHEHCLHFALNTERCAYVNGPLKIIGFGNQELLTVK
jgi:hypothetical protein